jgi:hypothetical protein
MKHTFEYIYNYFREENCVLISTEYLNNKQKLDYICCCGNQHSIRFNDFSRGIRCKNCGIKKQQEQMTPEKIEQKTIKYRNVFRKIRVFYSF